LFFLEYFFFACPHCPPRTDANPVASIAIFTYFFTLFLPGSVPHCPPRTDANPVASIACVCVCVLIMCVCACVRVHACVCVRACACTGSALTCGPCDKAREYTHPWPATSRHSCLAAEILNKSVPWHGFYTESLDTYYLEFLMPATTSSITALLASRLSAPPFFHISTMLWSNSMGSPKSTDTELRNLCGLK